MNHKLSFDLLHVTESAALASARWVGRGERNRADQAAVEAMRHAFEDLVLRATVVIGEGERDEAPMLYIGERVGGGWATQTGEEIDIAVDPLEGTNLCATDSFGAMVVLAVAKKGTLLHAPDTYMNKLAVGPLAAGAVDLRKGPTWNVHAVAEAKRTKAEEVTVVVLDRERHHGLIAELRKAGARVRLISDGDVGAVLALGQPNSGVDALMGVGGAPEGVLGAVAAQALGCGFQGQLQFRNEEERRRAEKMGLADPNKIYSLQELVRGDACFVASAVTDCVFGEKVRFVQQQAIVSSVVVGHAGHASWQLNLTHKRCMPSAHNETPSQKT